ncbi:MAG: murein hydrolase regulator LrgA [Pseudomonas kuykendallii]|uniref:Murein hydrolase regulator LrgA n=1 Tax=Pseudomonas kuykendallii TaxID=1007099 RepID=A0A2W5D020_9PSED|nr:MAG: murein hydrolase regulator LrgA [Pseudomonas kuykendallii]
MVTRAVDFLPTVEESAVTRARVTHLSRLLSELLVLLGLYLFGSQLALWLHWPIPGGVIGLGLLLAAFATGWIKPAALQLGAGLLMAEMLLFFIPALMSMLDYGALLRSEGLRILAVIACSTLLVMLSTALTVEAVCRWSLRHES